MHSKCRNMEKQVFGSMKEMDARKAGALWTKHGEGVHGKCAGFRGRLRKGAATNCIANDQELERFDLVSVARNSHCGTRGKKQKVKSLPSMFENKLISLVVKNKVS
jgi:hypothetical protein